MIHMNDAWALGDIFDPHFHSTTHFVSGPKERVERTISILVFFPQTQSSVCRGVPPVWLFNLWTRGTATRPVPLTKGIYLYFEANTCCMCIGRVPSSGSNNRLHLWHLWFLGGPPTLNTCLNIGHLHSDIIILSLWVLLIFIWFYSIFKSIIFNFWTFQILFFLGNNMSKKI